MKRAALLALVAACITHERPTSSPEPPTQQRATPDDGGTRVSWRNSVDPDFDATLVVRYTTSADGEPRADAGLPAAGVGFGSGQVLYSGPGESAFDPVAPQACKRVTYQFFTHDSSGRFSAPVIAIANGSSVPPGPPMSFAATLTGAMVTLTWVPTSEVTRIVRDGEVVYEGPNAHAFDVLLPGAEATWSAFACNTCDECSAAVMVGIATLDAGELDLDAGHELRPLELQARLSADAGAVALSWALPPDAGVTRVRVLRRHDAPVHGADDPRATVVFDGLARAVEEPLDRVVPQPLTNQYAAFGCAATFCEQAGATAQFAPTLSQALRAGGYVVWWRHATASTCADRSDLGGCTRADGGWSCPASGWWKSCDPMCSTATARQLTPPQSDLEIAAIRSAFSARGFPIAQVRSSEFCRVHETAVGFAFGPTVETTPDLTFFLYDEANRCATAYALLDTPPATGSNTALVSHAGFTCPVLDALTFGEAAVFKPDPLGPAIFVTRVLYDGWSTLP